MTDALSYADRLKHIAKAETFPEAHEEEYRAFAFGRVSNKPQISVTFRLLDAKGYNFAYSHYYALIDDHPNSAFEVEFTRHIVIIKGRNLETLHRLLCDHKVREVVQSDPLQAKLLPEEVPVVTHMEVRKKSGAEEL